MEIREISRRHPLESWRVTESAYDLEYNALNESLFALANGYIGLRGTPEEGFNGSIGSTQDGVFLNGFYETEPIHYPETAFGLAKINQFMLNVPNGKRIELRLEDERFDVNQGALLSYERSLDLRTGILTRNVEWISPRGKRVRVVSERIVSFENKHLFAIRFQVTPLNFSGTISIVSLLDGEVKNMEAGDDPRVGSHVSAPPLLMVASEPDRDISMLTYRTRHSGFLLIAAIANELIYEGESMVSAEAEEQRVGMRYVAAAQEGKPVTMVKYGAYVTSRDFPEDQLKAHTVATLQQARQAGFDSLCVSQKNYLDDFWQTADIEITGDEALQQGLRFNQFHLLQSVGRDGKTNISAKGLTGEGYEGHYFWDTEIYIFPFFLYNKPDIARKLLEYRYSGLDAARERARQLAHNKGALYPWRTIAGSECSAYFPAGTAQFHINADIAYSVKQYYEVTGDESFLVPFGAEMVMETARIWMGIGNFSSRHGGCFEMHEVTGPDEYTALVSNNFYTNAMAQMHLAFAAKVAAKLAAEYPDEYLRLSQKISLASDEPEQWRKAAEKMYLGYDEELGIHPQDDSFLAKPAWDFANTPKSHYPLLLNYHPLVIYRHQVCKQADLILALLLRGDLFTVDEKRRDYDYYESVTTHDSSLSSAIFSIIASEIGYKEKAYDYFIQTARMDLDNCHGNTHHGVHAAAMAGTWMGVVYGFGGMRVHHGKLRLKPQLPQQWTAYSFHIKMRDCRLRISVSNTGVIYELVEGSSFEFHHGTDLVQLTSDESQHHIPSATA